MAQLNQMLGDLAGNARALLDAIGDGQRDGAPLVVTPELSLCGYPPEDLLLRPAFLDACASELAALAERSARHRRSLVGFPEVDAAARATTRPRSFATAASSPSIASIDLPNYTVFDEERYFEPGDQSAVRVRCRRRAASASLICEDSGSPSPARSRAKPARSCSSCQRLAVSHAAAGGARRADGRRARARDGLPFVYVNRVGGQDELVFDGASFVMDADGDDRAAAAGVARDAGASPTSTAGAATRARRARPRARAARLRGAGDGRARLRREEPLSRRAARAVGRRRFGADARGRRRCARRATACAR